VGKFTAGNLAILSEDQWVDGNGDGFVDLDEITTTPIASG